MYKEVSKEVVWKVISYNEEASFNFIGEDNFSGKVIREAGKGVKAMQLQLNDNNSYRIRYRKPVIFNSELFRNYNFRYDNKTGIITIAEPGLYLVNWWVGIRDMISESVFAIEIIEKDKIIVGAANSGYEQVNGDAIIEVNKGPINIRLINATKTLNGLGVSKVLPDILPVKASLTIYSE